MQSARYYIQTKECSFVYDLLYTYSLANQIVNTDKSLRIFSAVVLP